MQIGDNVDYQIKGSTLTITVDLSKRLGPSASGKTIKIASSNGNVPLGHPSGATIGINVYTKEKG